MPETLTLGEAVEKLSDQPEDRAAETKEEAGETESPKAEDTPEDEGAEEAAEEDIPEDEDAEEAAEEDIPEDEDAEQDTSDEKDGEEGEAEPLDPPHFWSGEAKEHFTGLDRKSQEIILEQDRTTQAHLTKTEQIYTNNLKKIADESGERLDSLERSIEYANYRLEHLYPYDEASLSEAVGQGKISKEDAFTLLEEKRQGQDSISLWQKAAEEAREAGRAVFLEAESLKLQDLLPDLFGADEARKTALGEKIVLTAQQLGYTQDDLANAGAADIYTLHLASVGLEALKSQKPVGHAQRKTREVPKPVQKSPLKQRKAGLPPKRAAPAAKRDKTHARLKRTGSLEDAAALLEI